MERSVSKATPFLGMYKRKIAFGLPKNPFNPLCPSQLVEHRRDRECWPSQALLSIKGVSGACWELIAISSLLIRLFRAHKDRQACVRNHPTDKKWTDSCLWNLVIGVAGGAGFLVYWSRSEMLSDGSGGDPRDTTVRGRCAVSPEALQCPLLYWILAQPFLLLLNSFWLPDSWLKLSKTVATSSEN